MSVEIYKKNIMIDRYNRGGNMIIHTHGCDMVAVGPDEVVKEMKFSISDNEWDENFAMEVMSSQLYSDKLKIICQEYLSNARDAHREAGKANIPVMVHLPTKEEPWYEVSDHGNGISPKNFETIFLRYFASSKRGNDDVSKRQNGGFGLGAKSAWCYSPEFFVNTIHDGIEYRYHCYRNSEKKRVAALTSVSRIGKDECNGTTVRVNIKEEDIHLFNNKFRDITHMWGVKPKVVNVPWGYATFSNDDIIYENSDVIVFGNRYCGARYGLTALVDDIPYPIDVDIIRDFLTEGEYKFASNATAYIHCDKTKVDPTPNRENLEYNNRTRDYIVEKIKSSYAAITNLVQSKIDVATSYWNACCIWTSNDSLNILSNIIESPKYNGIVLPEKNEVTYDAIRCGNFKNCKAYLVYLCKDLDGNIRDISISKTTSHKFDQTIPFVYQVGELRKKNRDSKLIALYQTLIKDTVNHREVKYFNLVCLPKEGSLRGEILTNLEKQCNWSKLLKYDLSKVNGTEVRNRIISCSGGVSNGMFYEISNDNSPKLINVNVDFNGRHDVYVPIHNKTVTILGKKYRFDSIEVNNFKKITGIDFSQVKLYAVPIRFLNKVGKVKTMRSLDEAVTNAMNRYNDISTFDYVINKYVNSHCLSHILSAVSDDGVRVYKAIKGNISEDSIFAKVINMKIAIDKKEASTASSSPFKLDEYENLIIWYLNETKRKVVDTHASDTPEIKETRRLVDIYNKYYNPFLSMMYVYNIQYNPIRCEIITDIVNMIERKIAAHV